MNDVIDSGNEITETEKQWFLKRVKQLFPRLPKAEYYDFFDV